jgi:hypothetical protein
MTGSDLLAPFSGADFLDDQGKRLGATPRASNLMSTKPAPQIRAPRPEPARVVTRIAKDGRRSVTAAPPIAAKEHYAMPTMKPDAPALGHLKPRAISVISVKAAAQSARKVPVARVARSVGAVPGVKIDGYIER